MRTQFFFLTKTNFNNRGRLKLFLKNISQIEKTVINELNIIFCSDDYILKINKEYLHHNYHTDIITFEISNDSNGKIAEIYISIDSVKRNSIEYKTTIKNELHRVVFHGVLHLCGYKDKTNKEISIMRSKENQYLNLYFKK